MADKALIDACFMYCQHRNLEPIRQAGETQALVTMAVGDFKGKFSELNDRQRRMIAGVGLD